MVCVSDAAVRGQNDGGNAAPAATYDDEVMQFGVLSYRKCCPRPCGKSADLSQESDPPGRGEVCDGWCQHDRSHLRRQPLASKFGGFPPSRYGLVVGSCGSSAALTTDRGSKASRDWGGVLANWSSDAA